MATYISIINSVMRRLRESTVATPSESDYSTVIGEFVNETKREVEDAWKWNALRTQIQVTTAASTNGYSVTGAGKRFKFIDQDRRLYDATSFGYIHPRGSAEVKKNLLTDTSTGTPMYYYLEGIDSSGDPKVYLYSEPDGIYTINFNLVVPQADLSNGTDELSVPEWPVILGTYAKAIAERGEDSGRSHGEALVKYGDSLADAVAIDYELAEGEDTWSAR